MSEDALDFENRHTRQVFDRAQRRMWCLEQVRHYLMPGSPSQDVTAFAENVEAWIMGNETKFDLKK